MKLARVLLRGTDLGVSEIASRLGNTTPQYFISRFKSTCGSTPSVYRRESRL